MQRVCLSTTAYAATSLTSSILAVANFAFVGALQPVVERCLQRRVCSKLATQDDADSSKSGASLRTGVRINGQLSTFELVAGGSHTCEVVPHFSLLKLPSQHLVHAPEFFWKYIVIARYNLSTNSSQ